MGDLKPDDRNPDPLAGNDPFNRFGDLFCKNHHAPQQFVLHIEKVIDLFLRDHKGMANGKRMNVQEGKIVLIFGDPVTRDLPLDDF